MEIDKVKHELRERMADPFEKALASKLYERVDQFQKGTKTPLGSMLVELLTMAENGEFK